MTTLTLTLIGRDRTGLVGLLAERVAAAGGNWLDARMARLAGQFAGIVSVEVPEPAAEALVSELRRLEGEGLRLTVARGLGDGGAPAGGRALMLSLTGLDHPGIVRDITRALADAQINIEELITGTETAAFSGERLFRATARLLAPGDTPTGALRATLEALAHELMVDIELADAGAAP